MDTQGLVLEAKVHSANVTDRDGIKLLLKPEAGISLPRLSHLWLDAGYTGQGRGAGWVEKVLGWTAEIVRHPKKMAPEEVMMRWVREWAKEGVAIDGKKFMPEKGPRCVLRGLGVERGHRSLPSRRSNGWPAPTIPNGSPERKRL